MTRSRRRRNSAPPGTPTHTSAEWQFSRELRLSCPAGHRLGTMRQDTAGTVLRPAAGADRPVLRFDGPPEDPERTLRWTCPRCDVDAATTATLTRSGRPRRHETKMHTAGLLELLDALASHGPARVSLALDHDAVAATLTRVTTGEQAAAVRAAERSRIARRWPGGQPPDRPGEKWWQTPDAT